MEMGFIQKSLRSLFFWIDRGVYSLVEGAYNIITELARTTILGQETIESFASRIYVLIGIVMLFKVAFSLISMFLNPDSFNNSKAGGGKLVQRIVVSLLLLIMVPTIFEWGFRLQSLIIDGNVLPTIILGGSSDPTHTSDTFTNAGKMISVTVFKSFFTPDGCDSNGGNCRYAQDSNMANIYDTPPEGGTINVGSFEPLITAGSNDRYYFDYSYGVSTVAGVFVAWIMIIFCFDIAVRSVKLSFLQLIAPIPILSYVDVKKGDKIFNDWVKNCVSTYVDLFVRLISIYFVIFILSELTQGGGLLSFYQYNANGELVPSTSTNGFVAVFIILGLLLFAKEAPQLIYDILGIKPSKGGFTLNPMKRLGASPFTAALAGGAVGLVGGTAAGVRALANRFANDGFTGITKDENGNILETGEIAKNVSQALFSPLAGGLSAGSRAVYGGLTGGGKGSALQWGINGIRKSSDNRNLRAKGFGTRSSLMDKWDDISGIKNKYGVTSQKKGLIKQWQIELKNLADNEHAVQETLQKKIGDMRNAGQVFKFFNNEYNTQGGYYVPKTYEQYVEQVYGEKLKEVGNAYKDEFDNLNALYTQRQELDIQGRKKEKEINDLTDDLNNRKPKK